MRDSEITNAVIKSVEISNEDHGCLTAWLHLDYGGSGQGFGGFNLYGSHSEMRSANYCGVFIDKCLKIGGVGKWSQLVGKTIRVNHVPFGSITAIGHIVDDKWFNPKEEFEKLRS